MAKLTQEQLEKLNQTGRLTFTGVEYKTPKEIKYLWNKTDAKVVIPDLRLVIQPKELVYPDLLFPKGEWKKSQGIDVAVNRMQVLVPVDPSVMTKEDLEPTKSTLDKLEETYEVTEPTGVDIPAENVVEESVYIKAKAEQEEKEEKMNAKAMGKAKRTRKKKSTRK